MPSAFKIRQGASWMGRAPSGKLYHFLTPETIVTVDLEKDLIFFRKNDKRFEELRLSSNDSVPDKTEEVKEKAASYASMADEQSETPPIPDEPPPEEDMASAEDEDDEVEAAEEDKQGYRDDRPVCPFCNKDFKNLAGLKAHQRAKHPDELIEV